MALLKKKGTFFALFCHFSQDRFQISWEKFQKNAKKRLFFLGKKRHFFLCFFRARKVKKGQKIVKI